MPTKKWYGYLKVYVEPKLKWITKYIEFHFSRVRSILKKKIFYKQDMKQYAR